MAQARNPLEHIQVLPNGQLVSSYTGPITIWEPIFGQPRLIVDAGTQADLQHPVNLHQPSLSWSAVQEEVIGTSVSEQHPTLAGATPADPDMPPLEDVPEEASAAPISAVASSTTSALLSDLLVLGDGRLVSGAAGPIRIWDVLTGQRVQQILPQQEHPSVAEGYSQAALASQTMSALLSAAGSAAGNTPPMSVPAADASTVSLPSDSKASQSYSGR